MMQRYSFRKEDFESDEDKILRTVFDKNEAFLKRHFVLSSSVIGKLITTGVINDAVHARLRGTSSETQVSVLIQVLRRSGIRVFSKFIDVLKTSMDSWIADVILETDIAESILSGKKYTLTQHLQQNGDVNDDRNGYTLPYTNTTHPNQNENLSEMLTALQNISYGSRGMVSSTQLDRISGMFDKERHNQESTMAALRQEEEALRELLDQNIKEQSKTRRNQRSLYDIDQKLKQISLQTSQLTSPGQRSQGVRERLFQIQRIPKIKTVP